MGCCKSKNHNQNLNLILNQNQTYFTDLPFKQDFLEYEAIPKDKFLCPKCFKTAELLKVHTDNNVIELMCRTHRLVEIKIKDFFDDTIKTVDNLKEKCQKDENCVNEPVQYCYDCQINLCENHFNEHANEHKLISFTQIKNKCPNHNKNDITLFCVDCQEHLCEMDEEHKGHEKIQLSELIKKAIEKKPIIIKKYQMLNSFIRFYENLLNNSKLKKRNLHCSIKKENERKLNEIEFLNYISKINRKSKKQLKDKFGISLTEGEDQLILGGKDKNKNKLGNIGFNKISQLNLKKLKIIDVSFNNIKYISCIKRMYLPVLEDINMSNNEIENIKSVAELKSPKIQKINLENNKIKHILPFLNSKFSKLTELNLEGNPIDENKNNKEKLNKKYGNKIKLPIENNH